MKIQTILLLITVIVALAPVSVLAMTGGDYEISWSTIDGGGGRSSGERFSVTATIGQPDAGQMSGDRFSISGGFWPAEPEPLLLCFVNFEHFAELSLRWLDSPCNEANNFCDGADLDLLGDVGLGDVCELAYWWLHACPPDWPWQ
jgi:hypothetical protein